MKLGEPQSQSEGNGERMHLCTCRESKSVFHTVALSLYGYSLSYPGILQQQLHNDEGLVVYRNLHKMTTTWTVYISVEWSRMVDMVGYHNCEDVDCVLLGYGTVQSDRRSLTSRRNLLPQSSVWRQRVPPKCNNVPNCTISNPGNNI
jgi:hypothetical protein